MIRLDELRKKFEQDMMSAVSVEDYETAASYRDNLAAFSNWPFSTLDELVVHVETQGGYKLACKLYRMMLAWYGHPVK